ncbi:MAG: aldehyde dehydrogenase [Candidatus Eisenbacteria bacterium]|uniref:Aldehyde dehydrogenase n=1 Tax=Eiseniibacteriota bacterium TaxID=2212470 RepID=A0A7Y2H3C4_UNCEI|nr:aldehyde dehydrogenase [Candidatus Eisenbacteria bacterium]
MTVTLSDQLVSLNPATGEPVGSVVVTAPEAISGMVDQARKAQKAWAALTLEERGAQLKAAGEALEAKAVEIGTTLTQEMGKPLREGIGEVKSCARGMASTVDEIAAALQPVVTEDKRTKSHVFYDAFGVCAAIAPWNFPVAMPHSLVIPALMAGNAVILKPSEETPLSAQAYADVLNEFLPAGVLTVVHGADEQGKALVNADVDLIAFTGSRETGKKILENASRDLKRVVLELGGKDPMIVLDDANLEEAAKFAVMNSFRNAGQVCVSTERIYVDERVATEFENLMKTMTENLKQGDGQEEGTQIGPMINDRQRAHVLKQLELAKNEGARVVTGSDAHPERFIVPTILSDLNPAMAIMRDETFGPIACVVRYQSEEDAVRQANDTPFGLGAAVFGEEEHALKVARHLDAGMIGVNKSCGGASGTPWVGAKESGYGYHGSDEGHRQFAQVRVVSVPKG